MSPNPAAGRARGSGEEATVWALLAGGGAAGALAVARFAPGLAALLPSCPFRALTGLPCPTCRATRALLALAAGHPLAAAAWSPLAILAVLAALAAGLWGLGRLVAPTWFARPWPAAGREIVWARAAAVAVLLNWAYLLASSPAG